MESRRKWIIIIAVILVLVFFFISKTGSGKSEKLFSMPTSFDSGRNGHKALFLLLEKTGYSVERFQEKADMLNSTDIRQTLVIVQPFPGMLSRERVDKIYEWMSQGNNLLIIDDKDNELYKFLAVSTKVEMTEETVISDFSAQNPAADNVNKVEILGKTRLHLPPLGSHPFQVLLEDDSGVICAETQINRGSVIVLSAPDIITNLNISNNDNVIFIANIFRLLNSETILFDETIHGYWQHKKGEFKFSSRAVFILIQLGIAVLVFYLVFMIRFGDPRKQNKDIQRTSVEYVHSFANLHYKANSLRFALDKIIFGLKRRIGKSFNISPEFSDEKWLGYIENAPLKNKGKIKKIIEKSNVLRKKSRVSDKEIIDLARIIEKNINQP